MKKIKFLFSGILVLTFLCSDGFSQVKPGKGFNGFELGMDPAKAIEKFGNGFETSSYDDEFFNYSSSGYNPENNLPFFIGFDMVHDYFTEDKYHGAVYKIFFMENKATFLTISAYKLPEDQLESVGTTNGIHFGLSREEVNKILGKPDLIYAEERENGSENGETPEWYYFSKGLQLFFDNNDLMVFFIFKPMKNDEWKPFAEKLK